MKDVENRDIMHALNQGFRYTVKELNTRLKGFDLYASQWAILYCLDRFGTMTQTEIWKYLNTEAPTVTRTLVRLEENGWISRKQGKDKRERIIELTPLAIEKIPQVKDSVASFDQEMLSSLSQQEKNQLFTLLGKLKSAGENTE
ncbi:MarR family winged helix-turn-helix transcriptional regulator [Oceanobacillus manasiensis]|uniref:MarR family winged helix-turn-helix transcriptional regulator n=1 Tax=Oceanobacillus manasiensis TaxID=586413 RepID=UPI000A43502A|nr:MarR family transcriptional regulator [Oceanobacillus manasiensis]